MLMDKDLAGASGPRVFADFGKIWLDSRVDLKPTTRACYRSMLNLVNREFGETEPRAVTYLQVVSWISRLAGRDVSASEVRQAHQILNQVMEFAKRLGALGENPAAGVPLPAVVRHARHRYLTILELESLALEIGWWRLGDQPAFPPECAKSTPDFGGQGKFLRRKGRGGYLTQRKTRAGEILRLGKSRGRACGVTSVNYLEILVRLLGYTGLRIGEVLALTPAVIDLERRVLRVERAVSEVSGRQVFGTPKSGRTRAVPVPDFLVRELRELCRVRGGGESFLFATKHGNPLRASNLRLHFDLAAIAIGQSGLHIHDLRHTAATLAVSAGANVKAVQQMLGHSSAALTLDVYADLFEPDLDNIAGALSRMRRAALRRAAA